MACDALPILKLREGTDAGLEKFAQEPADESCKLGEASPVGAGMEKSGYSHIRLPVAGFEKIEAHCEDPQRHQS